MQFNTMMPHLDSFAAEQADLSQAFIQFSIRGSHYALDINTVNEIVEIPTITPYPEVISGHLGVVNLSGQVLPVLDFSGECSLGIQAQSLEHGHLLLVASFSKDRPFGLLIQHPRRVEVPSNQLQSKTINIHHLPVRILSQGDFEFKESES